MSMIQLLPESTQRLIRAGETIEAVAAAVRELVENALDAKADRIIVNYWPERWQIQVSDDGQGMTVTDLAQAAQRHTTSKIFAPEDLQQITSLGFRGEALFALSAVSQLEIASRLIGSDLGWRLGYDACGAVISQEPCGLAVGTVVTVRDLFGRLPVRRQMLNLRQESRAVQQIFKRFALARSDVTLQLIINDRSRLFFPAVTSLARRLSQVLGISETDLRTATHDIAPYHLELVLGLPDRLSRARADGLFMAINGRLVDDTDLLLVLQQSFQRTLPKNRHPIALGHWHLPPEIIDWNRHPAKQQVHLGNRPHLESILRQTVAVALQGLAPRPQPELFRVAEERATYRVESNLFGLKALSQVQDTYILAEHPDGLWLVEQHVCHERVLFEQLSQRWQIVEAPIQVVANLRPAQVENLEHLGLDIEVFGEGLWAVRSLPEFLVSHANPSLVLWELSQQPDLEAAKVTLACRTAIKNGTPITLDWAQDLLNQWQTTTNPHTCPHGRPIYLALSSQDLGHYFRRRYQICDNSDQALRERLSDRFEKP